MPKTIKITKKMLINTVKLNMSSREEIILTINILKDYQLRANFSILKILTALKPITTIFI